MTDNNSWEYKNGFGFYASSIDDETFDWTNLLECVADKLNNELHDQPTEDCFPMTIGAGDPEHENISHLADDVAQFLAERYREVCGHPHDSMPVFWDEMETDGLSKNIRSKIHDKHEQAVVDAILDLEKALSKFQCMMLETEEIEVTLEEIKQHAPELLVSND